ncbi:uncharacterized protein LOC110114119 [Dendrobium catenatum]|uniref:uncharacterized protein LOC110114119 n=1 Tax=Dendrobium catenatum TaxID=906689 RepID=UPI0009F55A23|nr:uncharacterized protein LOC110114119 [Dendrobium catenatum]
MNQDGQSTEQNGVKKVNTYMARNDLLDLDSGKHTNLMKDNVELGLKIEVNKKFEASVEDIEEGEMVNHLTVEHSWANLAVGARKSEVCPYLKDIVRDYHVFYIGIVETKFNNVDRRDVDSLIGGSWDFFHFPAIGNSGGILSSSQVIVGDLTTPSWGDWKVATIYGSNYYIERKSLWRLLESSLVGTGPSLVGGDFNCILSRDEKKGGKRFLLSRGAREMRDFMTNSDLHDASFIGLNFTWYNNKLVPSGKVRHLARVVSDHCPIIFKLETIQHNKTRFIRFEDTWRSYPAAWNIVYNSWRRKDFGDEVEVLRRKLRRKLRALFFWSKNKCKDLCKLEEDLKLEILELKIKEASVETFTVEDLVLLWSKVHELNITLRRLSTWWYQRAKARWQEEGDTNSIFFHNFASARRNAKLIRQIKDENNQMVEDKNQIEQVFIQFFEKKWRCRECQLTGWPRIAEEQRLSSLDMKFLDAEFLLEECKEAVFQQVNKLKKLVPKMISEKQMAFIPSRSMSEHCILTHEIFNKFKTSKNKKGFMAVKLDME